MTHIDKGRPAATVVIVREVLDGTPQFLMMERAKSMAFAAGALVFPGGGVDESDRMLAARIAGQIDFDEASARVAAIRETLEECGLGIGLSRHVQAEELLAMRVALTQGMGLADLLERHDIALSLENLVPFARWHPVAAEYVSRIYDTRFYLARAPEGQDASVDNSENVRLMWSDAASAIARCDGGDGHIIFPTRRNLERLAQFASFDELASHARSIPVETVQPWVETRNGEPHLCIPAHLGYPVTSEPMAAVQRG